jgi:hypothetical protein
MTLTPGVLNVDSDGGRIGHISESALVRGYGLGDVEAFLDVRHSNVNVVVLQEEELVGGTHNLIKR